jgi:hypothetical protein
MTKGFSVDEFKSRKIRLSGEKAPTSNYPVWLNQSKPKIVALVDGALSELARIQQLIEEKGVKLSVSERQIKNVNVCNFAKVTKSYLRADRRDTANVIQYIYKLNSKLAQLWEKKNTARTTSGRKLLRTELEVQVIQLKKNIKDEKNRNIREYFQEWVDMFLVDDRKRLVHKISDLTSEISELEEDNLKLKGDLKDCRRKRITVTE